MKKTLLTVALLLTGMIPAVVAEPVEVTLDYSENPIESNRYNSNHSMGCMMLRECTVGVVEITSYNDLVSYYGSYDTLPAEFQELLKVLNKIGSKVYIAPSKYFVGGTRGVYHTVSNNFFLND